MIEQPEIDELVHRAHVAKVSMVEVCKQANVFRQSWYRAKGRGRMEYSLYRKLETGLAELERSLS